MTPASRHPAAPANCISREAHETFSLVSQSVNTFAKSRVTDMFCKARVKISRTGLTDRLLRKSLVVPRSDCCGHGGQKNAIPHKLILTLFQRPS